MNSFWKYLHTQHGFSIDEVSKIRYAILSVISELSKILIMAIAFLCLGHFWEYVLSLIILCLVRTNTGGLHFGNYFICLAFTFLFFWITVIGIPHLIPLLGLDILIRKWSIITGIAICTLLFGILKPVQSIYRTSAPKELITKSRISTFQWIFIFGVIVYIAPYNKYILPCYFTLILQTVQLVVANIRQLASAG